MNEQLIQLMSMGILAGLGAGWLAETFMHRRGHGLTTDLGLGVGASLLGGGVFLVLFGAPAGILDMVALGFATAASGILVQRVCWPAVPGASEQRARLRLDELRGPSFGEIGTPSGLPIGGDQRPTRALPARALARMAATGIYLLRGVSRDLQRAARTRAAREGTTLRQVLVKGLGEYAAGTWTPAAEVARPLPLNPGVRSGAAAEVSR